MKLAYFIFTIPGLVLDWVLPFSPRRYKPSTEWERSVSQDVRNKMRLADYYVKRVVVPRR